MFDCDGQDFDVILADPPWSFSGNSAARPGRNVAAHAPQVCHQPACINPRHLRWALPDENMGDRVLDGTSNRGSRHGNSILNEDDVATIRNSNLSASDLAGRFGVSEATVRDVTTRRTWSHLK